MKNRPDGILVFYNNRAFMSTEMDEYLNSTCVSPIPRQFSAAYHQHQNDIAESLWARQSPLTTIFVSTTSWLGAGYFRRLSVRESARVIR